jgi:hypothetical protein
MGLISLLWGLVAMCWMLLALVPLLGWMNWFLIAFAAVGAMIAATGIAFHHPGGAAVRKRASCSTGWSSSSRSCVCISAADCSESQSSARSSSTTPHTL